MLHAGEVGLRRIGEQAVTARLAAREMSREFSVVDAHVGQHNRHVRGRAASGARELPDAVHRVVIVERQQELAVGSNGYDSPTSFSA